MNDTTVPRAWTRADTPLGIELTYTNRRQKAGAAGLIFGLLVLALFGYGALRFLIGWTSGGEEVLAGGVVLFLFLLGGAAFGVFCLGQWFRFTTVRMGGSTLRVARWFLGRTRETLIEKARIEALVLFYVRPTESGLEGTWSVLVRQKDTGAKGARDIALDGYTEAETSWLSAIVAKWAGVPVTREDNA